MNKQSIAWEMLLSENLVGKRFENVEELEKHMGDLLGRRIKLEDSTNEDDIYIDYNLLCGIETHKTYYYIDVYYLKTRNNELYITEIGVDNE